MKLIDKIKTPNINNLKNYWTTIALSVFLATIPVLILMNSCASTDHVRDWTSSEDYNRSFNKILIMGLVNRISLRNDIEYEMVDAANKIGLIAINSMNMFPPELSKPFDDTEQLKAKLREKNFDGILTVALIDVSEERYVGPETKYVPLVYYNRFTNYYHRTEALVYKPGYYSLQTRYFIETNLYELKNGALVWSGRSYAFDPEDIDKIVSSYAKKLFKELLKNGVIAY